MTDTRKTLTISQFLCERAAALNKTPEDVAVDMGNVSANVVTGILRGNLKLPFHLAAPLARALSVDAAHLLRLMLREYAPELCDALGSEQAIPLLSARERALIQGFRTLTRDRDVESVVVEQDGLLEVLVLKNESR